MRSTVASAAVLACVVLAGCNTTPAPFTFELTAADRAALKGCGRGDAIAGEDPVISAKRKENARRCEAAKRAALAELVVKLAEISAKAQKKATR